MTQMAYTPLGDMIFPIDIFDPGTDPDVTPAPVLQGYYAKVVGVWNNTEARKLAQQIVPEATHKITTVYPKDPQNQLLCLIKSRMYVMFRGRKMTIEKVLDPDEKQVEVWLLCTERNDGSQ